nr:SRPBCC domain-containing protein [Paenibacillus sp. SZ31]
MRHLLFYSPHFTVIHESESWTPVDTITVEVMPHGESSEMTFTQHIIVPHEEGWTRDDIEKAIREYNSGSEQGWHMMFEGLKQLLETGEINYPSQ